jgi:hypothetical protein
MRKMLVVSVALLLAATSAQGAYVLSLEQTGTGLNEVKAPGVYSVDLTLVGDGVPAGDYGAVNYTGAQIVLDALPAGWAITSVTYNTVDFDPGMQAGNDPAGPLGAMNDSFTYPAYQAKKWIVRLALNAPTTGTLAINTGEGTYVGDDQFGGVMAGSPELQLKNFVVTPEPATALLLLGALPFLRRRRA